VLVVVADTNVLLSAITKSHSSVGLMRIAWESNQIDIAISTEIIGEIASVLMRPEFQRKRKLRQEDVVEFIESMERWFRLVEPAPGVSGQATDPDDDIILATALGAQADCLITGDKALLAMKQWRGVDIMSPGDLVQHLRGLPRHDP